MRIEAQKETKAQFSNKVFLEGIFLSLTKEPYKILCLQEKSEMEVVDKIQVDKIVVVMLLVRIFSNNIYR